ncbi:MAG: hypothetical protein AVDCRST_MAG40-489, partial [uncultured Gemmatimonadaceae bacterium]
ACHAPRRHGRRARRLLVRRRPGLDGRRGELHHHAERRAHRAGGVPDPPHADVGDERQLRRERAGDRRGAPARARPAHRHRGRAAGLPGRGAVGRRDARAAQGLGGARPLLGGALVAARRGGAGVHGERRRGDLGRRRVPPVLLRRAARPAGRRRRRGGAAPERAGDDARGEPGHRGGDGRRAVALGHAPRPHRARGREPRCVGRRAGPRAPGRDAGARPRRRARRGAAL